MLAPTSPIELAEQTIAANPDWNVLYDPPAAGPTEGEFVPLADSSLHPDVVAALGPAFPDGLFAHQFRAIESALRGAHTVTATRTSSGKSLTFSLPAIDTLCRDPEATSLFLYPQKALANDQLLNLRRLAAGTPSVASRLEQHPYLISRYDGDVEKDDRKPIREQVQFLLSNPDMLHLGILQHHGTHWGRFFANLKYVAIDECHEYRGVFGSGVSLLLRRLRQICRLHGSDPTFIASSATIADPQKHMKLLTGHVFALVGPEEDRSRQGRRKFWMVGGADHHYDIGRKLAMSLADQGLSVLAFCPSRVAAERMLSRMRRSDGSFDEHVAVYRSGLSSAEREEIERGLREKSKRLVFSTSALELGIDIGQLDVVICIGLPGSMMSLWQRAGRVARAGREGAIVLIPGDSPIDTYYARHPDELFARDNEPIAINVENERLVRHHYACAIQELGGDEKLVEAELLGPTAVQIRQLRDEGKLDPEEFYRNDPHGELNLRTSGDSNYELCDGGDAIGQIGAFHLLREAPRNAIYRHGGRTYRVKDIIRGKRIVRLAREMTRNETIAYIRKDIRLKRFSESSDYPRVKLATGRVDVTEFLSCLTEKDPGGNVVRSWPNPAGMPAHRLPTEATLLVLKGPLAEVLRNKLGERFRTALESVERLMCGLFPTVTGPCDPQDYSSGCTKLGGGEPAIVLYDMAYDGVGLVREAYDHMPALIEKSLDRISSCDCEGDEGCFRCVAHPHQATTASKSAAVAVLKELRSALTEASPQIQKFGEPGLELLSGTAHAACSECQANIPSASRFCMNCGTPVE
ncbi:DEAD/DEAH box helicase [Candidatus Laterigemmans baculatus]|uniref:DEAD/DEAH box helicase n=1 Tax=Candidatus Laterigemmans baculatus TaxID=2770505 RepID=UPI0013DB819E|nr:DEAD/DEAH box helicase [Candidatus Laterigemmans baculatus]